MPIDVSTTGTFTPRDILIEHNREIAKDLERELIRESPVKTGALRRSIIISRVTAERIVYRMLFYGPFTNVRGRSAGWIDRAVRRFR